MSDVLVSAAAQPAAPRTAVVSRLADRRLVLVVCYLCLVLLRFAVALLAERPLIPTDELVYKNMALSFVRTGSFYNTGALGFYAPLPNVLYPFLIAPAFLFGGNFLAAIKLINALLVTAAVFPAYALAREFVSPSRALLAALFVAVLPSAALGAFVATDGLNLPLFLCCLLFGYRMLTRPAIWNHALCGLSLSLLLLSKPGAVGFGAGLLVACLTLCGLSLFRGDRARAGRILLSLLLTAGAFAASYVCLNFLLTGRLVYDLGMYKGLSGVYGPPRATRGQIAEMLLAHLLTPLSLYFIPFFVVVAVLWQLLRRDRTPSDERLLVFLVLGMAVSLVYVLFTGRFTVTIFNAEGFQRLHARYHFMVYAFSLLGLVVCLDAIRWTWRVKGLLVLLCVGAWLADSLYLLPKYVTSSLTLFDNPDLAWSVAPAHVSRVLWALSGLSLASILLARTGRLPKVFAGVFLAVLLCANVGEARHLRYWDGQIAKVTDEKTHFVGAVLPDRRVSVVVIDSTLLNRLVLAFWYPYNHLNWVDLPRGGVIRSDMIPPGTQYIVLFDVYRSQVQLRELYKKGQCSVCELAGR